MNLSLCGLFGDYSVMLARATGPGSLPGQRSVTGHRSIPDRNAERMEAARAYRRLHTGMAQAVADSLTLAHRCAHRYLVKGANQWESKDRMQRRTPTRRTSGPGRGGWRWGRLSLSKPCSTKTT